MKLKVIVLVLSSMLACTVTASAATQCPNPLTQNPTAGGGGISGVGGGGDLGFGIIKYINSAFQESFPQLLWLMKDDSGIVACVYDRDFRETQTPNLVATLSCTGGDTVTYPYSDKFRVRCTGPLIDSTLLFEATYLDVSREIIGEMIRIDPSNIRTTDALMIGH
jgi:hypothetical protein